MAKSFVLNSFPPPQDLLLHDQYFYQHLMDSSPPRVNFQFQLSTLHDSEHNRPDEMDFFARKREDHDHDHDQSRVTDKASDADMDFNVNVIKLSVIFYSTIVLARQSRFCNELTSSLYRLVCIF